MNPNSQFQDIIARSRELLVVLPQNPTFDTVAAGLSLYRSLASYGKKTHIFCSSPMLVEYNRLVGVDQVADKLGEKNLTITLRDYPAANIERVSYDIENGEMKLTIIPKENVQSPVKEQVGVSLSGMSAEAAILVGIDNIDQELGDASRELAKIPQTVSISTKNKPQAYDRRKGNIDVVDPQASSLSEAIGMLILNNNLPLDNDTANNLFQGLTAATNNFTSQNVRAETFELASKLMRTRNTAQASQTVSQQPVENQQPSNDETPQDWFKPKVYKGPTMP